MLVRVPSVFLSVSRSFSSYELPTRPVFSRHSASLVEVISTENISACACIVGVIKRLCCAHSLSL